MGATSSCDLAQPIAANRFLIVPIRAHILTAPDLELADCKLKDADVTRIISKVNTIWNKAGIYSGSNRSSASRPPSAIDFA